MLTKYVTVNNWRVVDYYVDDGISGTTFERGGFKRMLDDIEEGKINMVVTKDLSRLGRDYLKTGYYTEVYFPENNVRYIAVNDSIDTIKKDNDIAPFKQRCTGKNQSAQYIYKDSMLCRLQQINVVDTPAKEP